MSKYIVQGIEQVKDLEASGDRPALKVWRLSLEDPAGVLETAELVGKPDSEPKQGGLIEGDIEDGQWGKRFKRARKGGFGGGGRSPEETKSIVRQHSQEMALRYAAVQHQRAALPDDFDLLKLKPIIDWFVSDAGGREK